MRKLLFALLVCSFSGFLYGQNHSINLDGTDDVLIFPPCQGLTGSSFTIEGWVSCHPSFDAQVIMMAFQDNLSFLNANVTLEVRSTGLLRFNYRASAATLGGDEIYSTTRIDDDRWHHFAAVKDNNEHLILYIDGFMEAISCVGLENVTEVPYFEIGRNKYDGGGTFRWLHGSVDDFKIWTIAKTARDIFNYHQKESSGLEPDLYANYKFDLESDTIFDCSVNLHHGIRAGLGGTNFLPQFKTDNPGLEDVNCMSQATGADEAFQLPVEGAGHFAIQPNPVSNTMTVLFETPVSCSIQVVNMAGQVLKTVHFQEKSTEKSISVQNIPPGNYVVRALLSDRILTSKVVKI